MEKELKKLYPLLSRVAVFGFALCVAPGTLGAQAAIYSDSLLPRLRAAAEAIPGTPPSAVRQTTFAQVTGPLSSAVAGAGSEPATLAYAVFQIQFDDRYIMVDAGSDREGFTRNLGADLPLTYQQDRFDRVQSLLRDADRIVLTHEHFDHALGVQRGRHFEAIASKTLLSGDQLESLTDPPPPPGTTAISADSASHFRIIRYEALHPIAPGVVLVKAPGHSPGSQFVYVQLETGQELLFVGDLVWMMVGLQTERQKPPSISESIQEDREAIAVQMAWVRRVMDRDGIAVVPTHDKEWLEVLVTRGVLKTGLERVRQ